MGFFDLKVKCAICDNDVGLNRFQLSKNVWICPNCLKKLGGTAVFPILKKMNINEIKEKLNNTNEALSNFVITKKIGDYIYFDEENKKWTIPQGMFKKAIDGNRIFSYTDILNYELIEDGNSISKGGVGRAIVGGVLFGGAGAIVGGSTGHKQKQTCTKLQIKITLNNVNHPIEYITFISTETKKDSFIYTSSFNFAQQILSMLNIICQSNSTENRKEIQEQLTSNSNFSVTDEIKKYKELLDMGAITQEEYERKKKELLNL